MLAVDLGGLMIKVGQFMSSRLDVLPPEITKELEGLQDEVPAVPFPAIRALAEAELGMPLDAGLRLGRRRRPSPRPPSARRTAPGSRPRDAADTGLDAVVLKVQRPGIDEIVDVDLAALRKVGGWLSRVRLVSDRVDMPALVEEFAATSLEEIDYLHEAASSERFAADFADDDRVARARDRLGAHDPPRAHARGRHGDQDHRRRRAARRRHRPGGGGARSSPPSCSTSSSPTASSTPTRTPATSS